MDENKSLPGALPRRLSDDQPVNHLARGYVATGQSFDSTEAEPVPTEGVVFPEDNRAWAIEPHAISASEKLPTDDSQTLVGELLQFAMRVAGQPDQPLTAAEQLILRGVSVMVNDLAEKLKQRLEQAADEVKPNPIEVPRPRSGGRRRKKASE